MKKLPDVSSKYGAPMGRVEKSRDPKQALLKISMQRVPIDSGGYDRGGAYWGLGLPLYWASSDTGCFERFFRAKDRATAKATVRAEYPNATFYR